ncbi:hypothetical protein BCD91_001805 [Clostridium beijerinckii]|uniref:hypothetical protein n=1 Tax=Clostridium beijerinckii TaxID=1520 RepID=UPI0014949C04|nr:hypothetical protein [Clostridium beijerinckii]NOW89782.1 hypothetical protein [Clostridium beijerinckii]
MRRKIELEVNEKSRLKTLLDDEPVHRGSSLKDIENHIINIELRKMVSGLYVRYIFLNTPIMTLMEH